VWVEFVALTLTGAPRSPSRTAGYPNQRAHPCAPQEHARTLTHSTNRNDAPALTYLARTGFFKPMHIKSLSAHALRSLIIAPVASERPRRVRSEVWRPCVKSGRCGRTRRYIKSTCSSPWSTGFGFRNSKPRSDPGDGHRRTSNRRRRRTACLRASLTIRAPDRSQ
jgi:hypothetical protein